MLNKKSLISAGQTAAMLSEKGYSLYAVPGTPLAALVAATRAAGSERTVDITGSNDKFNEYIDGVAYMANTKDATLGGSPHDFAMDEMIATLVPNVARHFNVLKNVIIPDITQYVETVQSSLDAVDDSDITKHFEVKVWQPIAPISNGTIESYYSKHTDNPVMEVMLNIDLPDLTEVQIKETMLTLNPSVDKDIVEWMVVKGSAYFNNVWRNIFQVKDDSPWKTLAQAFNSGEESTDNALAVFLLANKLYDNPAEGVNLSLSNYNTAMSSLRNQASVFLANQSERYNSSIRNNVLVRSIIDKKIIVNEVVYKAWIQEGGLNEALFGLALKDGIPNFSKDAINENAKSYLENWAKYVSYVRAANKINRFTITTKLMKSVFVEQFKPDGSVLSCFDNMLNEVSEAETNNLWNTCKRLICRTVHANTDAETILSDIESIQQDSPNLNIREVTALANLKYITRYISSQIQITK